MCQAHQLSRLAGLGSSLPGASQSLPTYTHAIIADRRRPISHIMNVVYCWQAGQLTQHAVRRFGSRQGGAVSNAVMPRPKMAGKVIRERTERPGAAAGG